MDTLIVRLLGLGALLRLSVSLPPLFGKQERGKQWDTAPRMSIDPAKSYRATLHTTEGDLIIDLLPDQAPTTVNNFIFLAREGYYDGVPFHRIIKGFMVQTGDPTGTGSGGPGYRFDDEPVRLPYTKGIVAMANAGPNTNGSQFFIVHGAEAPLPPSYTIFGRVSAGMDVVDAIASVPVEQSRSGERSKPQREIRITSVSVGED